MNQPNLNWFYLHIVLALVIIVKDYTGTLEASLDRFEKKIGLYTPPPDSAEYVDPPFYIPPIQDEESVIDSNYAELEKR